MKTILMEVLSDTTNAAVVRHPGRKFPGLLVQGDSLHNVAETAAHLERLLRTFPDEEVRGIADELSTTLGALASAYEEALAREGVALPYVKDDPGENE